jgi:NAD-dependent DNA ligase
MVGLVHGSSLGALFPSQAFYYDQEPVLSDSEFDNLKQELQWEGSKVVVLT